MAHHPQGDEFSFSQKQPQTPPTPAESNCSVVSGTKSQGVKRSDSFVPNSVMPKVRYVYTFSYHLISIPEEFWNVFGVFWTLKRVSSLVK